MVLLRKISRRRRLADIRLYLFSKSPSSLSFFPRGEFAKEGSKIILGERSILATMGETSLDPLRWRPLPRLGAVAVAAPSSRP